MYPAPICCQFSYNMVISDLSHTKIRLFSLVLEKSPISIKNIYIIRLVSMHITNSYIKSKLKMNPSFSFLEKSINAGKYVSINCKPATLGVRMLAIWYILLYDIHFSNFLGKDVKPSTKPRSCMVFSSAKII